MSKQIKAMQAALTALKSIDAAMPFPVAKFAIHHLEEALAEALAKPDFWEGYVPEPVKPAQQEPVAWTPIDQPYPPGGELDILMGDGSILCEVLPQSDGDLWWGGASTGERFIDPRYANVTHWRVHAEHTSPPAQRKPLTDEEIIKCWGQVGGTRYGYVAFARAIEAAHGIKENT